MIDLQSRPDDPTRAMASDLWDLVDHYHSNQWVTRHEIIAILSIQQHMLQSELIDEAYDGLD